MVDKIVSKKVNDVHILMVCKHDRHFDADADRVIDSPKCEVEAKKNGDVYKFLARRIFDYGLVINPRGGKAARGFKGGVAENVENTIQRNQNLAWNKERILSREEQVAVYRKAHPTETGWGWNRDFLKQGPTWVPMTESEVKVYMVVEKTLPKLMKDLRM